MDTLTHALSGALAARASAPAEPSSASIPVWQRVALGTAAAAFPDGDVLLTLVSPIAYLTQHRGVTHSILMLPFWASLLAWLAVAAFRNRGGWRDYFMISALGIGVHIAGDWITSFGTMILAPLSNTRFALGTTFIIDLWFTGIILAGLLFSLAWRKTRVPAVAASLALAGYVGLQAYLKHEAEGIGRAHAGSHGLPATSVVAVPRPLSPFNWMIVVENAGQYHHAQVNLLRRTPPAPESPQANLLGRIAAHIHPVATAPWIPETRFGWSEEEARVAREAWEAPAFGFYRWFARFPALYRIDRGNPSTCVWFQDLRFLIPGRDHIPFRYGLCREERGTWEPFQLTAGGRRSLPP